MPAEADRPRARVGRFPDITLGWDEPEEEEKGAGKKEEGACKRFLRRICPCCCRHEPSDDHDAEDKVVIGATDNGGEKPATEAHELDGKCKEPSTGDCGKCSLDTLY